MKVLACGGRDFADHEALTRALDHVVAERGPIDVLVHGAARGADSLAGQWAASRGIAVRAYPADWAAHGRAAGPVRNQEMIDREVPDLVVAFAGGAGTADMVRRARRAGIAVVEVL